MNKDDDDDDDEDEDESHILSLGHHRMKSLVFLSLSLVSFKRLVHKTFTSSPLYTMTGWLTATLLMTRPSEYR
ncbi:hypothetical protein RDWZM_007190 [Blomia tropicalis]|uniref:Uncharacterized protein n=1 Tax=Blomia tropicalis TaxID=40697 RepID=A0A9Q0RMG8_BLOTA|nr:hypothetical protein RDWZM_007190 [Blomia tropicalis]